MVKSILVSVFFISTAAMAAQVSLTQKEAAELFLKQGPKSKEINLKYQQIKSPLKLSQASYDWKLQFESGYEYDKTESFSIIGDAKFERLKTTVSLTKPIATSGTTLGLDFTRLSQKADLSSLGSTASASTPGQANLDSLTLSLDQPLWGNSFGRADRATLRKAQADHDAQETTRLNELEDGVLEVIRLYWTTYVSQENFKEALASKDRYEKLVASVRRKNSVGYANPGELSQIEAEFEGRIQNVKTASVEYLKNLDLLTTTLGLSPGTEFIFSVDTSLPSVPNLKSTNIAELRALKSQQLKLLAANEGKIAAESKDSPSLNFIAKMGATGLDQTADASLSELTGQSHPKYYAGLKFSYQFGSGYLSEESFAKKANALSEEVKLTKLFNEETDRALLAERKVGSSFAIAESTAKQKTFREKAANELTKSFNQGRTDISVLIDAMNKHYAAQIQAVKALGDYQIALNEWAAIRDELIPEKLEVP